MSAFPDFEAYAERMTPIARGMARRYQRPEVCLEPQDLMQEALAVLWDVWRRLAGDLPADDLCRLGTNAVKHSLNEAWNRARNPRGIRGLICLSIDANLRPGQHDWTLQEALVSPEGAGAAAEERLMAAELALGLPEADRALLRELCAPSEEAQALMGRLWADRAGKRNGLSVHLEVLQRRLGLSRGQVLEAWARIQDAARTWAETSSDISTYQGGAGAMSNPRAAEEENAMDDDKTSPSTPDLPDPDELALGAPGSPASQPEKKESPVAKGKSKTKKAAKPASTKAAKKNAQIKADKKAAGPKVKKEKKAKVEGPARIAKKDALKVGATVAYVGGSRAEWLKAGMKGVITHHYGENTVRYAVTFGAGDKKKSTVVAAHTVKAA